LQNKTNASISSGVLGGQVQYLFTDYTVYAFNDKDVRKRMNVFSSISVLPSCQNANGSHISYTEVIEKNKDNSFTRYRFTNFDNGYLDEPSDAIIQESRTPYERYASKAHERGKLLLLENYDALGKKVTSKSIEYEKDITSNNYVRAMEARYRNVCPGTAVSYDEGVSYKIYTYLFRPKTETESFYDPVSTSVWQSATTNYVYTDKKLMRSVSFANSDGSIHKTEYKYPFDFSGNSVLNQMINNNILSSVVEENEYKDNQLLKKTVTDYKNWGNNLIEPERINIQQFPNGQLENRITYHKRDPRGNPQHISKDGVENTVYLWGYSYQYPIAEIKNAVYSDVNQYINEATLNNIAGKTKLTSADSITINNIRLQLPKSQITTYTYKAQVGLTSTTDPRGVSTYYEYDDFGRLSGTYLVENGKKKYIKTYQYNYAK
jgi:YD repeat-containing protein